MGNLLWIASYPKSGNTWMRIFIENYIRNSDRALDINSLHETSLGEASAHRYQRYLKPGQQTTDLTAEEICAIRPLVQRDMARRANGTIFVKTHCYHGEFGGFPLQNASITAGAIYVVRNPLDIVISMSNYLGYSIDETIDYMAEDWTGTPNERKYVPQIVTSWSMHVESWTKDPHPSCLVIRYEDMLNEPRKAFRKVESFLNFKKNPDRLMKAIRNSSFKQLKAQEQARGFVEKHEVSGSFFRQGTSNQWQETLTDAQVQRVVNRHRAQMERFKYVP